MKDLFLWYEQSGDMMTSNKEHFGLDYRSIENEFKFLNLG